MPSNEKIVIAILVIIILSLSIYTYTEVKRREAAEATLAKRETYIQHIFKGLDDAATRGELNQQAILVLRQIMLAATVAGGGRY